MKSNYVLTLANTENKDPMRGIGVVVALGLGYLALRWFTREKK